MLDICPRSNDTAQHHQAKAQEGHSCHAASKPEYFSVCDQDDCEVLEDSVDRYAKELERFRGGVDHADEEDGDWEPFSGFVRAEVAVFDETGGFAG